MGGDRSDGDQTMPMPVNTPGLQPRPTQLEQSSRLESQEWKEQFPWVCAQTFPWRQVLSGPRARRKEPVPERRPLPVNTPGLQPRPTQLVQIS
jgi:hypothetical protein